MILIHDLCQEKPALCSAPSEWALRTQNERKADEIKEQKEYTGKGGLSSFPLTIADHISSLFCDVSSACRWYPDQPF